MGRPEKCAIGEDEFEGELCERKTKKMQGPNMPTRTEVEERNLTDLPFRSWCRHCVRGREKELPHKTITVTGGQGAECQDDDGHDCASEECEIFYVKEVGILHGDLLRRAEADTSWSRVVQEAARATASWRRRFKTSSSACWS